MQNQKIQNIFFLLLLLTSFILLLVLFKPYIGIIVAAGALAIVFQPVHNKILDLTKHKQTLASLISVFLVILIIVTPLFLLGFQVYQEASDLYLKLSSGNFESLNKFISSAEKNIQKLSPGFSLNLNAKEMLAPVLNFTIKHLSGVFSEATKILLSLSLGLITLFYFFKEGREIKKYLANLSPLPSKNNEEIFAALKKTINASLKGGLLVAILQGIALGLGFLIFQVHNAALWGAVGVITSFVPGIGLAIIVVPSAVYLFATGQFLMAGGFLAWSLIINIIIDNFISPKLKKGAGLHPLLILFSVLGGISLFGPMGIIIGPMIASLFAVLVKIYPHAIKQEK